LRLPRVSSLDPDACVRVYPTAVETLRIGQLAGATSVSVRALRLYGGLGLLTPARADNPYRVFQPGDIERVRLIQLLLGGGFKFDEIRQWVPCFQDGHTTFDVPLHEVHALYARKLADMNAQPITLQRLRNRLAVEANRLEAQAQDDLLSPHG
jgi:MerR family copper efflux transcriptional regulator